MSGLSGGEAVVKSLRAHGVDTVFGVISSNMMEIYDSLYKHYEKGLAKLTT